MEKSNAATIIPVIVARELVYLYVMRAGSGSAGETVSGENVACRKQALELLNLGVVPYVVLTDGDSASTETAACLTAVLPSPRASGSEHFLLQVGSHSYPSMVRDLVSRYAAANPGIAIVLVVKHPKDVIECFEEGLLIDDEPTPDLTQEPLRPLEIAKLMLSGDNVVKQLRALRSMQ